MPSLGRLFDPERGHTRNQHPYNAHPSSAAFRGSYSSCNGVEAVLNRSGGGYRERDPVADRYNGDGGPRRSWSSERSSRLMRPDLSPQSMERERMRYERERERAWNEQRERERYARPRTAAYPGRDWPPPRDARDGRPDPRDGHYNGLRSRQDARDFAGQEYDHYTHPSSSRYESRRASMAYDRERDRDRYLEADRDLRVARDHWRRDQSPHRSGSPRSSSLRSSPSSSRRASPPPPSGPRVRRMSPQAMRHEVSGSLSATPLSASANATAWAQPVSSAVPPSSSTAPPPTGPRRSFGRPPAASPVHPPSVQINRTTPTGPGGSFDAQAPYRTPSRTYDRSPISTEGNAMQSQQQRTPAVTPHRDSFGRGSVTHLQLPPQSPAHGAAFSSTPSGGATASAVPSTPVSPGKRATWTEADMRGSIDGRAEAEAFNLTLDRIRGDHALYMHPAKQALRKALHELADSDVELAGARFKTSVTEAALEKAKEEAEAWSIESARIELEQRNSGVQGFWTVSSTTQQV